MSPRRQRMLGVAVLGVALAAATALTLTAFRKNLMNFYTPSDLAAGTVPAGVKLRLGGLVEPGSLRRGEGLRLDFVLADCERSVPVRFEGILPDLFREGQGIVATGSLDAERVFLAEEVLAKHDENYMPPVLADSLKDPKGTGHACAPFKPVTAAR